MIDTDSMGFAHCYQAAVRQMVSTAFGVVYGYARCLFYRVSARTSMITIEEKKRNKIKRHDQNKIACIQKQKQNNRKHIFVCHKSIDMARFACLAPHIRKTPLKQNNKPNMNYWNIKPNAVNGAAACRQWIWGPLCLHRYHERPAVIYHAQIYSITSLRTY